MHELVILTVVVERKDPSLPRFVVVPEEAVAGWAVEATTLVEVRIDGHPPLRRTLKRWPERRGWFVQLTDAHVRELGVDTGAVVRVALRRADEAPPAELIAALDDDPELRRRFDALPPSHRRAHAEFVREGKQAATRERRAEEVLELLRR